MNRRTGKSDPNENHKLMTLAPTVSLPALLDEGIEPDGKFRQLLYDISVVASHLESARQYLAERLGVTSPQYTIVMVVARSREVAGVSVSDVAARLNVTGAFVTNEVKKLVKAQLIVKKSNPNDGRGVLLSLSAAGYERVRALEPDFLMVNDRLFSTLSHKDFLHLASTMGSLINVFEQTVAVLKALSATASEEKKLAPALPKETRKKPSR